jgi:beta-N-acetylhexosaminidase
MIQAGYEDMVMTAHLYNANLDSLYPATLSEAVLSGILRDSLGFKGVIISDAMGMGAISNNYSFTESVVAAIQAGVDILLYTGNEKYGESVLKQINKVVQTAIDSGKITEARIDESYDRIVKLKSRLPVGLSDTDALIVNKYEVAAFPNPFNPSTKISFYINENVNETIQLNIFSINGERINRYFITINGSGNYDIVWNGTNFYGENVSSGTYIYQTVIQNERLSGKMTLLK